MSFEKFIKVLMILAILRYKKEVNCDQDNDTDLVKTVGLYYYSPYVTMFAFAIFIFY